MWNIVVTYFVWHRPAVAAVQATTTQCAVRITRGVCTASSCCCCCASNENQRKFVGRHPAVVLAPTTAAVQTAIVPSIAGPWSGQRRLNQDPAECDSSTEENRSKDNRNKHADMFRTRHSPRYPSRRVQTPGCSFVAGDGAQKLRLLRFQLACTPYGLQIYLGSKIVPTEPKKIQNLYTTPPTRDDCFCNTW